jgi:ceramide glucosyltransferase
LGFFEVVNERSALGSLRLVFAAAMERGCAAGDGFTMSNAELANLLLGLMAIVAVTATLAGMACLFWVTRQRRRIPGFAPPVTIFKPLKGLDEELELNLRSFFQLDYPCYQLLFCAVDADDPAIPVVERLLREFPGQDAQLLIGCPAFGLNPKVESLAAMEPLRKHDVILISDSNIKARRTYLRETVCYLAEPGVGLVSNLFAGVGEAHPSAVMENLQLNGFIAAGVAAAAVFRATCVVGKSMLMPVGALEAIGGFAAVRNVLAEDQVIAIRLRQAGYSIRLAHHVLENFNGQRSLRWFLNRHSRWYKIRRRVAPMAFLVEPIANLATVGLVWAFSGDSGIAWGGLLLLIGLGIVRDAVQTRWMRGSFPKLRHLLYSPVKDILLLPVWFDAIINRRVLWRGNRFLIGRMTRLRRGRVARVARRRLRGKRRLRPRKPDSHDRNLD